LVGVATAGIALGALVAEEMGLPYAYCRPKPKEHGMRNQLEGRLDENAKVVVVEDLISTGGSSLKVVEFLRSEGYEVIGLGALFTYGFKESEILFREADCDFFTLSNYHELIQQALKSGYINESSLPELEAWRKDPGNWNREGFGF
jgi:orotate phosphoribosyltransferase